MQSRNLYFQLPHLIILQLLFPPQRLHSKAEFLQGLAPLFEQPFIFQFHFFKYRNVLVLLLNFDLQLFILLDEWFDFLLNFMFLLEDELNNFFILLILRIEHIHQILNLLLIAMLPYGNPVIIMYPEHIYLPGDLDEQFLDFLLQLLFISNQHITIILEFVIQIHFVL